MKKLLSVSLALIMMLSLLVVPAMASSTVEVEQMYDPSFESYGVGYVGDGTVSKTIFSHGTDATAVTTTFDGSTVIALGGTAEPILRSNRIYYPNAGTYKLSFDVYLTAANSNKGYVKIEVTGSVSSSKSSYTNKNWTANGNTTTVADTTTRWTINNLPINTWVHVETDVTLAADTGSSARYLALQTKCDELSASGVGAYFDNLSFRTVTTGYNVNVTETNDYGTVVSSGVAADGTRDIIVIPDEGCSLASATLNGTDITADFEAADFSSYSPANTVVYTVNGANLTEDAQLIITYAGGTTPEPTEYAVTINTVEGATTSVDDATVAIGGTTRYTVVPRFGYYITGITVGGEAFTGFDAYKGGTYTTEAINDDTAIVVTTASYAANDKGVSTDVATLPSAFGSVESSVTFGKVLDAEATSWGVELTQNGEGVLTYHGGGPLYKANTKNTNGQYAVEFVGLTAGEYQVRTYVIVDGVKTFGAPATFVVQ